MAEITPIILVENDAILAERIRLDLSEAGYQVSVAETARIGLEHAKKLHPALIAIERALPGESALALVPDRKSVV